MTGLLSDLKHKTGEAIAYLHDQKRQGIQKFIGHVPWDHQPLFATLADQVGEQLGEPDAVLVFDPSGFPKKGVKSVGVARQWCGRLGKVDNCQVGVYMAYVSRKEHAIVNTRLYLPEEWAKDRERREEAGVPETIKFQTRHGLALEMLEECGGAAAARLGRRGRRDGPSLEFPAGIGHAERTLPAGGPLEPADPRHRGDTAGVLGAGTPSQESLHAVGSLVHGAAGESPGPGSMCVTARKVRW